MSNTIYWIENQIHDKKYFTARYLQHLSDVSGMEPTTIAKILCGFLFTVLTFSDQAHFVANSLLIGIPLLLLFVYPDERPSDESLYIYFPIFGGITLFDRNLERIPCYYVLKLLFFLLFYVPPYTLHQRISELCWISTEIENSRKSGRRSGAKRTDETSMRTAINEITSPKSYLHTEPTQPTATPSPSVIPSNPKSSNVKVTIIEEYYREEELLSPNGTVIDRVVSGPFRRETIRTDEKK